MKAVKNCNSIGVSAPDLSGLTILYFCRTAEKFKDEIGAYLKEKIPALKIEKRGNFFERSLRKNSFERICRELAASRVKNPTRFEKYSPLPAEIEFEKKAIKEGLKSSPVYDGLKLLEICGKLFPPDERNSDFLSVIFTNRLFATFDPVDRRYHLRVSVYGFPTLISLRGVVDAPAKPREFYLKLNQGVPFEVLMREFDVLDYEDPRIAEVMKGYVLQAFFYHLTGNPFCEDRNCRLYNAHWAEEVLRSQIESPYELCRRHQKILDEFNEKFAA